MLRALITALFFASLTPLAAQAKPDPTELDESASSPEDGSYQGPRWLAQPRGEDFTANYPPAAAEQSVQGYVTVDCVVQLDSTTDCHVVDESPTGWGFDQAALAVSRTFRVAPARVDGEPIGTARVRRTIRFMLPDFDPATLTPDERQLYDALSPPDLPAWDMAPTPAVVLNATPPAARDSALRGRGVLACRVVAQRRLRCETLFETPVGSGFAEAALTLAPHFRVAAGESDFITRYATEPFVLPINFNAPPEQTPVSRHFVGAGPVVMPRLYAPVEVFPPRALAAGIEGQATVLCTIAAGRALDCIVESETPTEWGLGAAVLDNVGKLPPLPEEIGLIPGDQLRLTVEFRPY